MKNRNYNRLQRGMTKAAALLLTLSATCTGTFAAEQPSTAEAPASVLAPTEDYSGYARPVVDGTGRLHLTDNHTIENVPTREMALADFGFRIPGAWADHIVIRTRYLNQVKNKELYKAQIQDSYVIRFFEKETWTKYHTGSARNTEQSASMGEIAELRIMNSQRNDLSKWASDPRYLHFGTVTGEGDASYELYLSRPKASEGLTDEQYLREYSYLSQIDYRGCLISSFHCREDWKLTYPNSYIRHHYLEEFDEAGEGMAEGSTMPEGYTPMVLEAAKNNSDTMPPELNQISGDVATNEYQWSSFVSPWSYVDRGSQYRSTLIPTPSVTLPPTPSETPTVTSAPESLPPAVTETPSAEPLPDSQREPSDPEVTNPPTAEELPKNEVTEEEGGIS